MAEKAHVQLLKNGVREWNSWRLEHREIRPNLSGADLRSIDLDCADLFDADLSGARISQMGNANANHADLSCADLSCAKLIFTRIDHANLSGADLSGAMLNFAYLNYTNLSGADLSDARLNHTTLNGASLSGANLSGTSFLDTTFVRVDLSNVKGLETAWHQGPSSVDINSVLLPHDESTRLHFLRGVGFTEAQIEYLPSLLTPRPIQYCSLFISNAHQDEVIANRLYADLRKNGVPCWKALHDLRPGTPWARGIEEAIHLRQKLLLILSNAALTSNWVKQEVETALYKEGTTGEETLFPIRLDNTILESDTLWAKRLCQRHIGDFTNFQDEDTYQHAFTDLLRHLQIVGLPASAMEPAFLVLRLPR